MTREIIALSNLYNQTKKKYKEIRTEFTELELTQSDITLVSIKKYFDEMLEVIPKSISINLDDRLQIKLEKTFYYDTLNSKNNSMPIVLLEDKYAFHPHFVLDRTQEGLHFGFGDEVTTFIQTDTLECLITNWKTVKRLVNQGITIELRSILEKQLNMIINKMQFLETLENWKV